jgi:DNA invertase Pin-like site-specific DNA recombinase
MNKKPALRLQPQDGERRITKDRDTPQAKQVYHGLSENSTFFERSVIFLSYCMYLRKSRADAEAEAHGEGETLARHEKALLELAKRQNLNVTEIYREIVSGETIAARPVMQHLLSEVEQDVWTGVLVMEVERLARGDTMDQGLVAQTFKFGATKIITPAKTYDPNNEFDEEYFEFGLFMSRREYKTINRRLQRGRLASVMEGKYVASQAPYGYIRVKLEKEKGYTLAIDPERGEIVKMIFDLYINGETTTEGVRRLGTGLIAGRLNQMNIPPLRHQYWVAITIRDILINPVYAGKIRWNYRPRKKKIVNGVPTNERARNDAGCIVADGLHPPIVSPEVFKAVQEGMAQSPPAPIGRKLPLRNPLAGLIVCGRCGRKMVLQRHSGKTHRIACYARSCDNVGAPYALVEKRIFAALKDWLRDYKVQWGNCSPKADTGIEVKRKAAKNLKGDAVALKAQLSGMHDFLERGVYTVDQFLDRSRSVSERIKDAEKKLKALEKEIEIETNREKHRVNIAPKIEQLFEVYENLPNASAKNDLLKEVMEKAVYIKTERGSRRRPENADKFELTVFPKLPQK